MCFSIMSEEGIFLKVNDSSQEHLDS
jgi:hypothetical protein